MSLARDMLWKEGKEIRYCLELVESLLGHPGLSADDRRMIATEILEGRKILKGINEGHLVEDGKQIRSLADLVERQEKELRFHSVKDHMEQFPYLYVDHAAGGYSLKRDGGGKIPAEFSRLDRSEVITLRKYNVTDPDAIEIYGDREDDRVLLWAIWELLCVRSI